MDGSPLDSSGMSRRTIQLDAPVHEWLMAHTLREVPIMRELREAMEDHPEGEKIGRAHV